MRQLLNSQVYFRLEQITPFQLFQAPVLTALRRATRKPKLGWRVERERAWPRVLEHLEDVEWSRFTSRVRFSRERFTFKQAIGQIYAGVLSGHIWSKWVESPLEREIRSLAFLIAVAWNHERYQEELLDHWKNDLVVYKQYRSVSEEMTEKTHKIKEKREGYLRIDIETENEDQPFLFFIIKRSKNNQKWLKPVKFNGSYSKFDEVVLSISPVEERVIRFAEIYISTLELINLKYSSFWSRPKDHDLARIDLARDQFIESMIGFEELYFEGKKIEVLDQAWSPRFLASDTPSQKLSFRWESRPSLFIGAQEGWVLGPDYKLMRCSAAQLSLLNTPLFNQPLEIEEGEIDEFIKEVLPVLPADVDLQTARLEALKLTPEPVLRLTADKRDLIVEVKTRYQGFEPSRDDGALFYDSVGIIQRDLTREAEHRALIAARLGGALPLRLPQERVYDFLIDDLPQLDEGWIIDADKTILRPRGALSARVNVSSGIDWFDLEVDFEVGGVRVGLKKVMEAWRRKQRYIELPGGAGLARLPDAWLAQHGEAAEEVESLRRLNKKRLGVHSATAVEGLLGEAGEGEAAAHWRAQIARIRQFEQITPRRAPEGVEATLRGYQEEGYAWLTALREMKLGAVLADDMGLGKTLQALCLLVDEQRRSDLPALVVAPTSVIFNWIAEARRFTPSLSTHLYYGPKRVMRDAGVIITSYPLLRRDIEKFQAREWSLVILDEAQHIKNPHSGVAAAARMLNAQMRVALTGTPIENHLMELWSLFQFLMPGFFSSADLFKRRYFTPIQKHNDEEAMGRLRARIRPFILRRLKHEVATELPPRQEQILYCELGPAQRKLYESVRDAYRESVLESVKAQGMEGSTLKVLAALTRLRQACCHPELVPLPQAKGIEESAKLDVLFERLDQLIEDGHRSLIFSQWPSLLKIVLKGLDARGYASLYLDGQTRDRATLQDRWNDPKGPPVFLVSIKAGGSGLNLTGADHVFHLDPWWNPAVEQQANDRAHRIGQTKPVMIYKLVAQDTAEEKILELQARKQALFDAAVNEERLDVARLTQADLEAVFNPSKVKRSSAKPKVIEATLVEPKPKLIEATPAVIEPKPIEATPEPAPVAVEPKPIVKSEEIAPWLQALFNANGDVTTGEVASRMGCSRPTARKHLKGLEDAKLIERRGAGSGTRYHLMAAQPKSLN